MRNRTAVIDLGTNTFHLLIAEGSLPHFTEVAHATEAVKLGEGGINEGIIHSEAYRRGIKAMQQFKQLLDEHQPSQVKAMATSALRNAANGAQFIDEVKSLTDITIQIIDGDTEAEYIYHGIKSAGCLTAGNNLIVDIGGGSVELIWCNEQEIFWKRSFEIGAARLMARFHQQDPIPPESINGLFTYLDSQLADFFSIIGPQHINTLIGSSGAFETYAELLEKEKGNTINWKNCINYTFETEKLTDLFRQLAASSHAERTANKNILPVRVDMIVVAALLTQYLADHLHPDLIKVSAYSLKEGMLAALLG